MTSFSARVWLGDLAQHVGSILLVIAGAMAGNALLAWDVLEVWSRCLLAGVVAVIGAWIIGPSSPRASYSSALPCPLAEQAAAAQEALPAQAMLTGVVTDMSSKGL